MFVRKSAELFIYFSYSHVRLLGSPPSATEMIPTIEIISAKEMTANQHRNDPHHRNDTYSQSGNDPVINFRNLNWLKWTWDFAIYSKFFV